jgi:hypothetical protein
MQTPESLVRICGAFRLQLVCSDSRVTQTPKVCSESKGLHKVRFDLYIVDLVSRRILGYEKSAGNQNVLTSRSDPKYQL